MLKDRIARLDTMSDMVSPFVVVYALCISLESVDALGALGTCDVSHLPWTNEIASCVSGHKRPIAKPSECCVAVDYRAAIRRAPFASMSPSEPECVWKRNRAVTNFSSQSQWTYRHATVTMRKRFARS